MISHAVYGKFGQNAEFMGEIIRNVAELTGLGIDMLIRFERGSGRIIQAACNSQPRVEAMVRDSALSRKAQRAFLLSIRPRFKLLHC